MKEDREELEKSIYHVIKENQKNASKIRTFLEESLREYNIRRGKTYGIFNSGIPLSNLNDSELYLFTKYLFETTREQIILPDNWFYPEEIKSYEEYKAEDNYEKDIIILNNVDQTSDNVWFCTKSTITEIANIVGQGLLNYNKNNQRGAKLVRFGDKFQEQPNIMKNKVNQIKNAILKNKFTANTITINIRRMKGNTERFGYDPKSRTLWIESNGETSFADIIDGAHRCEGFLKAYTEDKNNQSYTSIRILHYTEDEAQDTIEMDNRQTPIDFETGKAFLNDEYVLLAKDINKYGTETNNELNNKIALTSNEIKTSTKYVTVSTFAEGLRKNFTIDSSNVDDVKEFLIKFFNKLLTTLKKKELSSLNSLAFKSNMFVGYITLAKVLMDKEDWKDSLEKTLGSFDFKDEEFWYEYDIKSTNLKANAIKRIVKFFREVGE